MDLKGLKVHELIELINNRELKIEEINSYYINRIKDLDNKIGAFIYVDYENVNKEAKKMDKLLDQGKDIGPLKGIPIGIKDNINVIGMKTTCASKILKGYISPYNATIVDKLTENGAIIMGKTNMDEFGMGSTGENSAYKITRNPIDLNRVPGGSSSGSAAATSSEEVPISLGTDTGGSIRRPASYCGLVGLKPTYGSISRYGVVSFASTLDTVGILSKDVEDSALMYSLLRGKDKKDSTTVHMKNMEYKNNLKKSLKGYKIAIPIDIIKDNKGFMKRHIEEAAKVLKSMGADIKYISMESLDYATKIYYILSSAEASSNLGRFDGIRYGYNSGKYNSVGDMYSNTRTYGFNKEVKKRILFGTYALSKNHYEDYYIKSLKLREKLTNSFRNILKEYDAIIIPTTNSVAEIIGTFDINNANTYSEDLYTVIANLTGMPAISIPCAIENGLPLGMQIITDYFREDMLFNIAYSFERATNYGGKIKLNL